jgi:hypothetical protein
MMNLRNYGKISNDQLMANYFKIKQQLKECMRLKREGHTSFCELCFGVGCSHKTNKDTYEQSLAQLNWWGEMLYAQLVNAGAIVIDDDIVPLFPKPSKFNPSIDYTIIPALEGETVGIVINEYGTYGIADDGTYRLDFSYFVRQKASKVGSGIYWGTFTDGDFWLIAAFRDGVWDILQRFSRPPKFKMGDEIILPKQLKQHVKGYWLLPIPSDYMTFSNYIYFVKDIEQLNNHE